MDPSSGRVLLVDDEPAILKLLANILKNSDFDVHSTATPAEAMEALSQNFFDLIITDAIMPGTSGYDFVKTVRQHPLFGHMPILMLTKKRNREDVKMAMEVGVTDYILKPIDEHLLLEKVQQCMKKGGGKRQLFELSLHGDTVAEAVSQAKILKISEGGLTLLLPYKLTGQVPIEVRSKLFQEIGMERPIFRMLSSEASDNDPGLYETRFSFVGVPEDDLKKIRAWLQRELIRRRK